MLSHRGFTEITAKQTAVTPPALQLLPHDVMAESALIGALLIDPDQMIEVGYLDGSDFYLLNNGYLYQALKELYQANRGYDLVTVANKLDSANRLDDIGGEATLADFVNATPTSYGARDYAAIVYRHSIQRQIINRCAAITQETWESADGPDALTGRALEHLAAIDSGRNLSQGPKPASEAVSRFMDRLEAAQAGQVSWLPTGIKTLDHLFGGFERKQIYVLAGRPGMGKSALAIQFAYNLTSKGHRVLFFSLEMDRVKIISRLVSSVSGVEYARMKGDRAKSLTNDEWLRVIDASDKIATLPLLIEDTPALTVEAIRAAAQRQMTKAPVDLVIIDHVGIIKSSVRSAKAYERASLTADEVMALPKQLDCPVFALSQLSREVENRNDRRPVMKDLRDSGKWEENADGILFLYRDEVYNPDTEYPHMAEIIVAKNRDGEPGMAMVYADIAKNRFVDLQVRSVTL